MSQWEYLGELYMLADRKLSVEIVFLIDEAERSVDVSQLKKSRKRITWTTNSEYST